MTKSLTSLLDLNLKHVWHPCTQMKRYECYPPLIVKKASGSMIELHNGHKVIDAISSWWCKSLGHSHPQLKKALIEQLDAFEHVMLANMSHQTIIELSEKLATLLPPLNKMFYASDGSCAVEAAMKMSLQQRIISGDSKRCHFMALSSGYHGDTTGSLSVCDIEAFRAPYEKMLFKSHFINDIPYVFTQNDPLYDDCRIPFLAIEKQLQPYSDSTTALVLEPIVQGAGGMKIYSQDFLKRLRRWTKQHNIHLIADEIMTGIGRTGKMFASNHADIVPDFICLSKGLTSGMLPLSVVLTHDDIYNAFYSDDKGHAFLHSHTYSGNALATRVALETLRIIESEALCEKAQHIGQYMLEKMQSIAKITGKLKNVRGIGAIVAADLVDQRFSIDTICQRAITQGVLLRPLGNSLYWLPPLNISTEHLEKIVHTTQKSLDMD